MKKNSTKEIIIISSTTENSLFFMTYFTNLVPKLVKDRHVYNPKILSSTLNNFI